MPGFTAIASASKALERLLDRALADAFPAHDRAHAKLVTTDELRQLAPSSKLLSIFLLRVEPNLAVRQTTPASAMILDLHYLLTPWSPDAPSEQTILARTLACIHDSPILPAEAPGRDPVQLLLSPLPGEALTSLFTALPIDYRPSIPLLVRGLRLDAPRSTDAPPPADAPRPIVVPRH